MVLGVSVMNARTHTTGPSIIHQDVDPILRLQYGLDSFSHGSVVIDIHAYLVHGLGQTGHLLNRTRARVYNTALRGELLGAEKDVRL